MKSLRKETKQLDFDLIQQARVGNERAFKTLCANNTSFIKNIIKRMTQNQRSEQSQDDYLQMVYIKMWQKLHDVENISIKGWISRITTNLILDEIRRLNKVRVISLSNTNNSMNEDETVELEFFIKDDGLTPEQILSNKETVQILKNILNGPDITDIQKKVLHMRYVEEMKYEDIAEALKMNLNNVKGAIHKTRKILQKGLKNI